MAQTLKEFFFCFRKIADSRHVNRGDPDTPCFGRGAEKPAASFVKLFVV